MTVKVKRIGGSVAVLIPAAIASQMRLSAGTAMDVTQENDALVMRKQKRRLPRRPFREIVAQLDPKAYKRRRREDIDQGVVGKEVW